jgi:hypothetical protein
MIRRSLSLSVVEPLFFPLGSGKDGKKILLVEVSAYPVGD